MTTLDIDTAPSGPPPVATRHDHQGLIVTKIERPASELIATCVPSTRASCSITSAGTAA
jgi:hypothetical protein